MKKSVIAQIANEQKQIVLSYNTGLLREELSDLPDIQTHALIVSGIRRCGKSTLLHQFINKLRKDAFYLNFEEVQLYEFSIKDFALLDEVIAESGFKLLFFDEIQVVAGWELYVRQKLDQKYQVVITGSNASLLSSELGTKLTGRHINKELFPFSYKEFIAFKNLEASESSLYEYIKTGGFPEFVKTSLRELLNALVEDIIHRDIAVRHAVKDVASLKRLCLWLLSNSGNLFSPNKLKEAIGVKSSTTILEYISHFEACYLVNLVQKFSYSAKAQMLAPKKVYVIDPGIINATSLSFTQDKGHILETIIYWHLRRQYNRINYFNEGSGECDFVTFYNNDLVEVIQVCEQLTPENEERELNGLCSAMTYFKTDKGIIVTASQKDTIRHMDYTIQVIPAYEYLTQ